MCTYITFYYLRCVMRRMKHLLAKLHHTFVLDIRQTVSQSSRPSEVVNQLESTWNCISAILCSTTSLHWVDEYYLVTTTVVLSWGKGVCVCVCLCTANSRSINKCASLLQLSMCDPGKGGAAASQFACKINCNAASEMSNMESKEKS